MAIVFTPETGAGVPDANSYLSLVDFKDFSDAFGKDYSMYTDLQIEIALMKASLFMDSYFSGRYPGDRKAGQGLAWPREEATYMDGEEILDTVVPKEIKHGTMEAFYIVQSGANYQPAIEGNGILKEERIKVDVIEEQKKYNSSSTPKRTTYVVLEDALNRLTGGMSSLVNLKILRVGGYE